MNMQSDFPRISNYSRSWSIMLFCLSASVQCPDDRLMAFTGELPSVANTAPESGCKRNLILFKIQLQRTASKPMSMRLSRDSGSAPWNRSSVSHYLAQAWEPPGSANRTGKCSVAASCTAQTAWTLRPGQECPRGIAFQGFFLSGMFRASELGRVWCWPVFGARWGGARRQDERVVSPF